MKQIQIYTDETIEIISKEQLKELKPLYNRKQRASFICSDCGKKKVQSLKFINEDLCCRCCCAKHTLLKTKKVSNVSQLESVKKKIKKTKKKLYGDENYNNPNKMKKTCEKIYGGVGFASKILKKRSKETNLLLHGNENWNNPDKNKETCNEIYGCDYSWQAKEVKRKIKETQEKLYGGIGLASKEIREKQEKTMDNIYGIKHPMQSNILFDKSKKTKKEKYNDENYNNREKYKETCKEIFGYENPMQSPEFNASTKKKYLFEGIYFDSNWEIILYKFLKDHNIDFKFHDKNTKFTFFYNIERTYIPDFIINGNVIEIKGPHFFKDGKMICPWKHKNDTPEKIEWRNGLFEAKHQCMLNNGVRIITDVFEFIEELKYGL